MKTLSQKSFFLLFILSIIFLTACSDSVANQLKKEVETMKNQCPINQGNGAVMTDVNFYESEKVIEYIASIENVESIDATTAETMKTAIVDALKNSGSTFGNLSIKMILEKYGYTFRYIYTDANGKKLCKLDITKSDLK